MQLFRGPPARTRVTPLVLVKYARSEGGVSSVGAPRDRQRLRQRRSRGMRIKTYNPTIYSSPPLRHQSGEARAEVTGSPEVRGAPPHAPRTSLGLVEASEDLDLEEDCEDRPPENSELTL